MKIPLPHFCATIAVIFYIPSKLPMQMTFSKHLICKFSVIWFINYFGIQGRCQLGEIKSFSISADVVSQHLGIGIAQSVLWLGCGWMESGLIPSRGKRFSSSPKHADWLWGSPCLLFQWALGFCAQCIVDVVYCWG